MLTPMNIRALKPLSWYHTIPFGLFYVGDKPEIDAPLEVHVLGKEIALGGEITLTCKATGRPPLSYTWLCNDDPVSSDASHPEFTIKSMSDSDKGEYKCKVSSEVGFTTSEPVTLTPGKIFLLHIYRPQAYWRIYR